jgi:hypothetical protein
VKEANVAGAEQDGQSRAGRDEQARAWADVLRWELERVGPAHVFCVGQDAHRAVRGLQRAGHLLPFPTRYVCHDSARGADEPIIARIVDVVQATLGDAPPARAARQRPEPTTSPPALPGSRSPLAGKRVVRAPAYQAGGNPRRPGSHGYNAYELIPPGDRGIRVEELLAGIRRLPAKSSPRYGAGGTNHIRWDLAHGFTVLVDEDVALRRRVGPSGHCTAAAAS